MGNLVPSIVASWDGFEVYRNENQRHDALPPHAWRNSCPAGHLGMRSFLTASLLIDGKDRFSDNVVNE